MYYILSLNDEFIGIALASPYALNIPNISISEVDGTIPDLNTNTWNSELGEFVERTDKVTKLKFLSRFTLQERIAIRASIDPVVVDIMSLMEAAEYVSLVDPNTIQGIQYLALVGLLTSIRVQEVLS